MIGLGFLKHAQFIVATPYATSKREQNYSQPFGVTLEDPVAKPGAENHVVPKTQNRFKGSHNMKIAKISVT